MDLAVALLWAACGILFLILLSCLWWYGWILGSLISGGGPYVPTAWHRVHTMIRLASITPEDVVVDLGSGDGRLVIAAVQAGAKEAIGYEIHPGLVGRSRRMARRRKLGSRARFEHSSFWHANVKQANVVFLYQIPYAMKKIAMKLHAELPANARVVSNAFELPGWTLTKQENGVRLYVKS